LNFNSSFHLFLRKIDATDNPARLKSCQQGLRASFQCQECIGIIEQHRTSADPDDYNETFSQEAQRLLVILNGRIQTFLKELVKIFKIQTQKKSIYEDYKEMYSLSLRINEKSSSLPKDLYEMIEKCRRLFEKNVHD